jgi:prevent-host-death family protein
MNWHLQDAKNNFSKLVREAIKNGPQTVTLRGERAAVLVSADEYDRLTRQRPTMVDYLLNGPDFDDELAEDINRRSKGPVRSEDF